MKTVFAVGQVKTTITPAVSPEGVPFTTTEVSERVKFVMPPDDEVVEIVLSSVEYSVSPVHLN